MLKQYSQHRQHVDMYIYTIILSQPNLLHICNYVTIAPTVQITICVTHKMRNYKSRFFCLTTSMSHCWKICITINCRHWYGSCMTNLHKQGTSMEISKQLSKFKHTTQIYLTAKVHINFYTDFYTYPACPNDVHGVFRMEERCTLGSLHTKNEQTLFIRQ